MKTVYAAAEIDEEFNKCDICGIETEIKEIYGAKYVNYKCNCNITQISFISTANVYSIYYLSYNFNNNKYDAYKLPQQKFVIYYYINNIFNYINIDCEDIKSIKHFPKLIKYKYLL